MKYSRFQAAILAGNISLVNDQSLFYPAFADAGNAAHGSIMAANDANFDAQYLSEPLQTYIVGAPEDEGLQDVVDVLFPSIPVSRRFSYRTHDTMEAFQADANNDDDIREIGGDFKEVRLTGTPAEGMTDNKGLVMVLDNDQGGEDAFVQQRAVTNLRNRLLRSELIRGINLLSNAADNNGSNWGPSATKPDPDVDLLTDVDAGGDVRGVDSNRVVIGGGARIKRIKCYRAQLTSGSNASASMSNQELADFLGVDNVTTVRNRKALTTMTKGKIMGDLALSYYAKVGAMPDDPSNIKRFITATPSGPLRVYVRPVLKKTIICVEHYSRLILTSSLGIKKRTITFT